MQWDRFVCPSCSQKRENTEFQLVPRGLSSPGKQVARSSTPCRKRSQVWDTESEQWSKYMQQSRQCLETRRILKSKLSPIRVNLRKLHYGLSQLMDVVRKCPLEL